MPAAPESPARRKVTDTHGPFVVGEFRVLRVGPTVALHFGTTSGRYVFHVSERDFTFQARGECDGQGKPFRSMEVIERERRAAELLREGKDSGEEYIPPVRTDPLAYQRAWLYLIEDLRISVGTAAERAGLSEAALKMWLHDNHPGELTKLRRAAGIKRNAPRKSSGDHDGTGPLLKPSGRIL